MGRGHTWYAYVMIDCCAHTPSLLPGTHTLPHPLVRSVLNVLKRGTSGETVRRKPRRSALTARSRGTSLATAPTLAPAAPLVAEAGNNKRAATTVGSRGTSLATAPTRGRPRPARGGTGAAGARVVKGVKAEREAKEAKAGRVGNCGRQATTTQTTAGGGAKEAMARVEARAGAGAKEDSREPLSGTLGRQGDVCYEYARYGKRSQSKKRPLLWKNEIWQCAFVLCTITSAVEVGVCACIYSYCVHVGCFLTIVGVPSICASSVRVRHRGGAERSAPLQRDIVRLRTRHW